MPTSGVSRKRARKPTERALAHCPLNNPALGPPEKTPQALDLSPLRPGNSLRRSPTGGFSGGNSQASIFSAQSVTILGIGFRRSCVVAGRGPPSRGHRTPLLGRATQPVPSGLPSPPPGSTLRPASFQQLNAALAQSGSPQAPASACRPSCRDRSDQPNATLLTGSAVEQSGQSCAHGPAENQQNEVPPGAVVGKAFRRHTNQPPSH